MNIRYANLMQAEIQICLGSCSNLGELNYVSPAITKFMFRAYSTHDAAHDICHAITVYRTAKDLAEALNYDMTAELGDSAEDIFALTTLGHDIHDHKIINKVVTPAETQQFYAEIVGGDSAQEIMTIHQNCSWSARARNTLSARWPILHQILCDADWIEAIDLQRCVDYTQMILGPNAAPADIRENVCKHIYEKLLRISASLYFDASRELAAGRDKELRDYLDGKK